MIACSIIYFHSLWLSLLSSAAHTLQIYLARHLSDTHGSLMFAPEALKRQATQADSQVFIPSAHTR